MPAAVRHTSHKHGILHALLPGARVDKNTKKIIVRVGSSNETIIFNIGGTVFETFKSTLRSMPNSPLANDEFLAKHFRPDRKDHFFDRDPEIFHCVLNYLRTGELHLPTSVCGPVVKSELEYWGVDEMEIEECCWSRYSAWASTLKALRKLEDHRRAAGQPVDYHHKGNHSFCREHCRKCWLFFSDPSSSTPARFYSYLSLLIIFISIFSFCAQTHEAFKVTQSFKVINTTAAPHTVTELTDIYSVTTETNLPIGTEYSDIPASADDDGARPQYYTVKEDVAHPILYFMDVAFVIYFLLELLTRFLVSPRKWKFITSPMPIVEFLALLPDLIDILVRAISSSYLEYRRVTSVMDFLKVLRVFRIFRLMKHIPGLWILFYTLKASVRDLLLLLLFVFVGMLVFSSLIYFAENDVQESFSSIPKCFWWAVVTMTTVGYGDMYPVTVWGYLIGTATGISGVLMIGFTVPVLVNNFIMYYNHTRSTMRREKQHDSSIPGLSNLHTQGSMKCFSSLDEFGLGERIMGIGSFKMATVDKNANDNDTLNNCGIVFHTDNNKRQLSTETCSGLSDDDDECKEIQ